MRFEDPDKESDGCCGGERPRWASRQHFIYAILKTTLALLVVFSSCRVAVAQEQAGPANRIYSVSRGSLYVGASLDLATTIRGFQLDRYETNPLISKIPG